VWEVVELLALDALKTVNKKCIVLDKVKDIKARTIIIGYYILKPLSRILYLKTV
jgi:hypothetical protein